MIHQSRKCGIVPLIKLTSFCRYVFIHENKIFYHYCVNMTSFSMGVISTRKEYDPMVSKSEKMKNDNVMYKRKFLDY